MASAIRRTRNGRDYSRTCVLPWAAVPRRPTRSDPACHGRTSRTSLSSSLASWLLLHGIVPPCCVAITVPSGASISSRNVVPLGLAVKSTVLGATAGYDSTSVDLQQGQASIRYMVHSSCSFTGSDGVAHNVSELIAVATQEQ